MQTIAKVLSDNDVGATGAHQAGILVPKTGTILSFFPSLDAREHNPRTMLRFVDDMGTRWEFAFIYYNNALVGGTRNEYRLTRMTKFFKSRNLKAGDEVILQRDAHGTHRITYRRQTRPQAGKVLKLGTNWKVIPFEGER